MTDCAINLYVEEFYDAQTAWDYSLEKNSIPIERLAQAIHDEILRNTERGRTITGPIAIHLDDYRSETTIWNVLIDMLHEAGYTVVCAPEDNDSPVGEHMFFRVSWEKDI